MADGLDALAPSELGKPHLGVTAAMVGDWERGKHKPRAPYPRLLCKLFNTTAVELGLVWPLVAEGSTLEVMQRRAFLAGLGAFVGGVTFGANFEPWQRLRAALARPRRLDPATVHDLQRVTATLEETYATVTPAALVGTVQGHLATLTELLEGPTPGALHAGLCSLAGETAGLAGWVYADLGDQDRALHCYDAAIRAAQEAKDAPLGAYLVGSASALPLFRERSPQTALQVLRERARGFRSDQASPTTRAWLTTLEAEACVNLEDEPGCLNALDTGEAALESPDDEDARPIVPFFDRARLAGERGLNHLRLGQPDRAAMTMTTALRDVSPSSKIRARLLAGLATARLRQGEVEEACRLTSEALEIAARTETTLSLQQVRDVRSEMTPWADTPAVRELDEQLAVLG